MSSLPAWGAPHHVLDHYLLGYDDEVICSRCSPNGFWPTWSDPANPTVAELVRACMNHEFAAHPAARHPGNP